MTLSEQEQEFIAQIALAGRKGYAPPVRDVEATRRWCETALRLQQAKIITLVPHGAHFRAFLVRPNTWAQGGPKW